MGIFFGGSFLGENCPVGIIRGAIFRVGVVQVGIFRVGVFVGGNCSGGTYPRWEFSLVEDLQVGIVRWESSGWYFPGGSFHVTRS